jgi:homogentisate solanesyltransferase
LATKLGVRKIAFLGSGLLLANYVAAIVVPFLIPQVGFLLLLTVLSSSLSHSS